MSKGGTKTVQTQSSVPAFIEPFYERGLSEAQRLYEQPGPSYFPGSTVVSMAPETQSALSMARDRAIAGSPLTRQAQQYTQDVLGGQFLGANPFFQQMFDPAARAVTDTVTSQFAKSGRLGSGAYADVLSRNLGDLAGRLSYDNYQQERARQDAAAQLAPGMAALDYQDLDRLQQIGGAREQQAQAELQDQVNRFQFEQTRPQQKLADYLTAVRGGTFGSTQTTPVFRNRGAGFLGGALGGAQLAGLTGINPIFGALGGGLLGGFG